MSSLDVFHRQLGQDQGQIIPQTYQKAKLGDIEIQLANVFTKCLKIALCYYISTWGTKMSKEWTVPLKKFSEQERQTYK